MILFFSSCSHWTWYFNSALFSVISFRWHFTSYLHTWWQKYKPITLIGKLIIKLINIPIVFTMLLYLYRASKLTRCPCCSSRIRLSKITDGSNIDMHKLNCTPSAVVLGLKRPVISDLLSTTIEQMTWTNPLGKQVRRLTLYPKWQMRLLVQNFHPFYYVLDPQRVALAAILNSDCSWTVSIVERIHVSVLVYLTERLES